MKNSYDGNDGTAMNTVLQTSITDNDGTDGTDGNLSWVESEADADVVSGTTNINTVIGNFSIVAIGAAAALPSSDQNRHDSTVSGARYSKALGLINGYATRRKIGKDDEPLTRFPNLSSWDWVVGLRIVRVILPIVVTGVFSVFGLVGGTSGRVSVFVVSGGGVTLTYWRCGDDIFTKWVWEVPTQSDIRLNSRTEPESDRCITLSE